MAGSNHRYSAFDLRVSSDFELDALFQDFERVAIEKPDVTIRRGAIVDLEEPIVRLRSWVNGSRSGFTCRVPGGGIFQFLRGGEVFVDSHNDAEITAISDYIAGYGFPSFLHYTEAVPMHMSVVQTPSGCWAFAGQSGAGKSTTAALVSKIAGWELMCDDVCAMRLKAGSIHLSFGYNRFKVWRDSADILDLNTDTLERDPARPEKFIAQLPFKNLPATKPLKGVVFLEWHGDPIDPSPLKATRLSKSQSFALMMNSIHSNYLCALLGRSLECIELCQQLVTSTEVVSVKRSRGMGAVHELIEILNT